MAKAPGSLAEFEDSVSSSPLPGCCLVPRELMSQVEANFALPLTEQKTIAACGRWLRTKGYDIGDMNLRNHVRNGHAGRFA